MEQLHELEKRVLDVIQKNKELQAEVGRLKTENKALSEKNKQFEAAVVAQDEEAKSFETEKSSIKTTITDLLKTINSLEMNK